MDIEDESATVLGLGAMGTALARGLLRAGHPVTVWNRTPARAEALVAEGARVAPDPTAAVAAGALTVVCLLDDAAVAAVLDPLGDDLAGAVLVNLTSGTPEQARDAAARLATSAPTSWPGRSWCPRRWWGRPTRSSSTAGRPGCTRSTGPRSRPSAARTTSGADPGRAALFDLGMLDVSSPA